MNKRSSEFTCFNYRTMNFEYQQGDYDSKNGIAEGFDAAFAHAALV